MIQQPDNTQELDKIIAIFQDHAASNGYPMNDEHKRGAEIHMQAILDWHNKQTLELLDKLEGRTKALPTWESTSMVEGFDVLSAIEAERNKIKESK